MRITSVAEAEKYNTPKFELGRTVATPGALEAFPMEFIQHCLRRHHGGDWGDVGQEDAGLNDADLVDGGRLLSVYNWQSGKMWIITEHDRSVTTVLCPDEY